jgi:hypothetical protein
MTKHFNCTTARKQAFCINLIKFSDNNEGHKINLQISRRGQAGGDAQTTDNNFNLPAIPRTHTPQQQRTTHKTMDGREDLAPHESESVLY